MTEGAAYHVWRSAGMWLTITRPAVSLDVAFDLVLDHGRCVIVRIPEDAGAVDALAEAALAPEERTACAEFTLVRRRTWIAGRAALREALARAGLEAPPILADDRGAPALPIHAVGSISHKEHFAAGLVGRAVGGGSARIGIDLEDDVARTTDIAPKVLTDGELAQIAGLSERERARAVLLRFSAKEAIYKGLDPFVRRYVGFKEVSVAPSDDGRSVVTAHFRPHEGPFAIDVRWRVFDGIILTTARVEALK
jgi:4'-phosphopantetheinyl transferase EntD